MDKHTLTRIVKAAFKAGFDNGKMSLNGPKGPANWENFRNSLGQDLDVGSWVPPSAKEVKDVKKADLESDVLLESDPTLWARVHFYTQPARIRMEKRPTLYRLAQIYFNIGSMLGMLPEEVDLEKAILDFPINTFIHV